MGYIDLAPTFDSVGVTKQELLNVQRTIKEAGTDPLLNRDKALSVLTEFANDEVPYVELAQKNDLTSYVVEVLHQEWIKVRADADAEEEDEQ